MKQFNLKKGCLVLFFTAGFFTALNAQEPEKEGIKFSVVPNVKFTMRQVQDDNCLYSPFGSLQFMLEKNEDNDSNIPDLISARISYGQDIFSKGLPGYDQANFHHLGFFEKVVTGKNSFLLKIDGNGADPFESYKNFEGLLMYGRKIIDTESTSLMLGGGLAATDTGIQLGGVDLFLVPLPMLYFNYTGQLFTTEFEWIGLPNARFVLFPEKLFRIKADLSFAGFKLPVDINFDTAFACYPIKEGPLKDYFYISAGLSHNIEKFRINQESSVKYHYFCAYAEVNATAIGARAGYTFGGNSRNGFYLLIQGMYKF